MYTRQEWIGTLQMQTACDLTQMKGQTPHTQKGQATGISPCSVQMNGLVTGTGEINWLGTTCMNSTVCTEARSSPILGDWSPCVPILKGQYHQFLALRRLTVGCWSAICTCRLLVGQHSGNCQSPADSLLHYPNPILSHWHSPYANCTDQTNCTVQMDQLYRPKCTVPTN